MFRSVTKRSIQAAGAAIAITGVAGLAAAQCQPAWETAIGNPGIAGGYAAPVRAWNAGTGEAFYVGGSFTSVGGSAAGRYLARWNEGTNTWSPLGSGISPGFTNAFMTSLVPFNPGTGERLVAGGFYASAGVSRAPPALRCGTGRRGRQWGRPGNRARAARSGRWRCGTGGSTSAAAW